MSQETDKLKGTAKEMAGKATGSDELAREGEQQQEKAEKRDQADTLEDAAEQKEAEAQGHAAAESRHQ